MRQNTEYEVFVRARCLYDGKYRKSKKLTFKTKGNLCSAVYSQSIVCSQNHHEANPEFHITLRSDNSNAFINGRTIRLVFGDQRYTYRISCAGSNVGNSHTLTLNTYFDFDRIRDDDEFYWYFLDCANDQDTFPEPKTYFRIFVDCLREEDDDDKHSNRNSLTNLSQNLNLVSKISISPNPSKGQSNITLDLEKRNKPLGDIQIVNLKGNLVKTVSLNSKKTQQSIEWDTNDIPSGIYIVKLQTSQGIITKRLVVE